jgi:hypothetical protein
MTADQIELLRLALNRIKEAAADLDAVAEVAAAIGGADQDRIERFALAARAWLSHAQGATQSIAAEVNNGH